MFLSQKQCPTPNFPGHSHRLFRGSKKKLQDGGRRSVQSTGQHLLRRQTELVSGLLGASGPPQPHPDPIRPHSPRRRVAGSSHLSPPLSEPTLKWPTLPRGCGCRPSGPQAGVEAHGSPYFSGEGGLRAKTPEPLATWSADLFPLVTCPSLLVTCPHALSKSQ